MRLEYYIILREDILKEKKNGGLDTIVAHQQIEHFIEIKFVDFIEEQNIVNEVNVKKIFCLVGASGTGKSTILNYVRSNFNIKVSEVSARPFLPQDKSYVESSDDFNQVIITQNRFVCFMEPLITGHPMFFSRSPIDGLAYGRVLGCATHINDLLKRQIELTSAAVKYLYVPIEFDMKDEEDKVRGVDIETQKKTDEEMVKIMEECNIKSVKIFGTKKERLAKIDKLLKEYKK